ncbi:MAG: hypothetical protein ACJ8GN_10980 [Longimicrobiaceae bacterium]
MSVRQVGGSPDGPVSNEERERLKSRVDERLLHVNAEGEEVLDEVTRIYRRGARKYWNALRELAK